MLDGPLDVPITPETLFNGVRDLHIDQEVFRCTLFSRQRTGGEMRLTEVARIACPSADLPDVINEIVLTLTNAARVLVRVRSPDGH